MMKNSLFLLLYKHEVSRLTRSLRFRISLPLLLLLFICSSRLFVSSYTENLIAYEQQTEEQFRTDERLSGNLTNLVNERRRLHYPPREDGFLYSCKEEQMVNTFQYTAWLINDLQVRGRTSNPLLDTQSLMDWTFIVSMFVSFIALLFSYDSICGEKRDKELAFLFSYPVSRKVYWIGKIASHITVVMLLLLGGVLVGVFALADLLGRIYSLALVSELVGFVGISLLCVSLFTSFGLFASVITHHSNVSLLLSVSFWLFSAIIVPNSAVFLGNTLYPVPLIQDVIQEIGEEKDRLLKEAPIGSLAKQNKNPSYPYHERRAILFMKQNDVTKRMSEDFYQHLMRQFEGTRHWMLLSPGIQYECAMESLLGGGYLRFLQNWIGLKRYQMELQDWFKKKDAQDPDSPHWYNPLEDISTSTKSVDVKEMPCYQELPVTAMVRLRFIGIYVGVTFLLIVGLIYFGFRLFDRYDIR